MRIAASPGRRRVFGALLTALVAAVCASAWPATGSAGPIQPAPDPCAIVATNCAYLGVTMNGNGSGVVTSSPAGINCTVAVGVESGVCGFYFTFTTQSLDVVLTGKPAEGSLAFFGVPAFPYAPPTTQPITVTGNLEDEELQVRAVSFVLGEHVLTVTRSGAGAVRSTNVGGIDCGTACSSTYTWGTKVTLSARPDAGAGFRQWTGACAGEGPTCTLTIKEATTTNAVFDLAGASTASPPGGQQPDSTVEADVIAATSGRSRIGKRLVKLELSLDENVSAALTLRRSGAVLASKRFARVREGNRVLTLVVPAGAPRGKATLAWELTDAGGNVLRGKRQVRITKS